MNKDLFDFLCYFCCIVGPFIILYAFFGIVILIGKFLDWILSWKELPNKINRKRIRYIKETDYKGNVVWYIQFRRIFTRWKYLKYSYAYICPYTGEGEQWDDKRVFYSLDTAKDYVNKYCEYIKEQKIKNIKTQERFYD